MIGVYHKTWLGWIGCAFDMIIDGLWVQTWLGMKFELYFFSVVLEGIWEGKRKPRRGS